VAVSEADLALAEAGIGPGAADGLLPITPGWLAARLIAIPGPRAPA
jgi:flagellar biosynthesis protein FlhF